MNQTRLEKFIEENAGVIVASCIFFSFFVLMIMNTMPDILKSDSEASSIDIQLSSPDSVSMVKKSDTMPKFEPARETNPEPAKGEKIDASSENLQEQSDPLSFNMQSSDISNEEIAQQKTELTMAKEGLQSEKGDIKSWLEKSELHAIGKDKFRRTDGSKTSGVSRVLNFEGFSKTIIDEILTRYHITISTKYIKADIGYTYINEANLGNEGMFVNKKGEGVYEVFELSPLAVQKLTSLEVQEIQSRDLESSKTKVTFVKFSIIKDENNNFDLGITEFRYETIR